jgi:exodeoxyribonuclease VII large subunit
MAQPPVSERLPLDDGPRPLTLTRLMTELNRRVTDLGRFVVEGEVHQARKAASGMTYFTLRDRAAEVPVVVAASVRRARVVNGERVAVTGTLALRPGQIQVQLAAVAVVPVGAGAIANMIAETRERLRADGTLTRPRRALPLLPECVAVVCGNEAAVKHDIAVVAAARFPGFPIHFIEVTVQGHNAPESIVDGLRRALLIANVDVVIIARGGGDATQLLPFSDELVCRAIAAATVPVVSAIGHESDRPLCDEVADVRAGTPSIAAATVIPELSRLTERIDGALRSSQRSAQHQLAGGDTRLSSIGSQWRRAPQLLLERNQRRLLAVDPTRAIFGHLDRSTQRLHSIAWRHQALRKFDRSSLELSSLALRVEALAPHQVLRRGYAIVRRADGGVVRSPSDVTVGHDITITIAAGSVSASVTATSHDSSPDSSP